MKTLWIVGQRGDDDAKQWEMQGVFDSEAAAVAACRDWSYFVGPITLNEQFPHETMPEWPGAWFPITRTA